MSNSRMWKQVSCLLSSLPRTVVHSQSVARRPLPFTAARYFSPLSNARRREGMDHLLPSYRLRMSAQARGATQVEAANQIPIFQKSFEGRPNVE